MFANKKLLSRSLTTLLLLILNQQILLISAQQNFLPSNFIDKTAEQLVVGTNQWLKNLNSSVDSLIIQSSGLPQSIRNSAIRSQLIKATPVSCYECNSYFDPDCETHPEKFQKNCTDSFAGSSIVGCRRLDQWVDYDQSEEMKAHHRVIRQCATDGDISKPCYYRAGYGGRMNACFCDHDLCNYGFQLKADFILIPLIISSLFICSDFSNIM